MRKTFEELFVEFGSWTEKVFPLAGPIEQITHGMREMSELVVELYTLEENEKIIEEFADCFMCLMGAAYKAGFTSGNVLTAIQMKFEINKTRKWKKNPDNTYSHIEEIK